MESKSWQSKAKEDNGHPEHLPNLAGNGQYLPISELRPTVPVSVFVRVLLLFSKGNKSPII